MSPNRVAAAESKLARMVQRVERDCASRFHWRFGCGVTDAVFADLERSGKHDGLRPGTGPSDRGAGESESGLGVSRRVGSRR
jgi:hypothetical protein